jgi:hypothetical protein
MLPQGENHQAGHILSIKNDLVDRSKKKEPQGNCSSFARRFHPETKLDGRPINITVHGIPVGAISDIGTKKKGCRRWIGRAAQKRRDQSRSGRTLLISILK